MYNRIFSLTLAAIFLCCFASRSMAQAGGTNPQLYMYRHNSSPGVSPTPVLVNDLLGTLQWRGLTAIGEVELGATIKSMATNVSPGILNGNMLFATSGAAGLTDKMIITPDGLVGIGELSPTFNLHVAGNTHTTGRFHGRIHYDLDLGNANSLPSSYVDEAYFERKNRLSIGMGANTYTDGGTLSLAPGGSSLDRQIFTGGDDGLWTRSQTLTGGNGWEPWEKILTSGDINGNVGRVPVFFGGTIGDPTSEMRNSQLFDNGTNVSIGGTHPPTPPTFNADYLLTVNSLGTGNALTVNGQTFVNGRIGLGVAASATNRLQVSGNSQFDGNIGLGTAPGGNRLEVSGDSHFAGSVGINKAPSAAFDLDVNGDANVDGKLVIGNPTSTPGSHELYINGSAIAEEIIVKLQPNWPDYVFENDYDLKPLSEVEEFVNENKHLPGVATANEISESGLSLGLTQKAQMEKIEELFLYVIQQQKQLEAQQKTIERLETEIQNLKK